MIGYDVSIVVTDWKDEQSYQSIREYLYENLDDCEPKLITPTVLWVKGFMKANYFDDKEEDDKNIGDELVKQIWKINGAYCVIDIQVSLTSWVPYSSEERHYEEWKNTGNVDLECDLDPVRNVLYGAW